ncbi:hypothetical protein CAG54_11150 [Vibrio sp. V27_P1S3P104]|uniref:hypothetical protein n=2 Tax=unclassified Vibrio TaxID=2614977 RepID=UPI0013733706|nr:hypothetical protein [Vibrio sp. V27_P1S3P104]NAX38053.1 hypothetical protein [Vibrio sp. V27_P1S3P104]
MKISFKLISLTLWLITIFASPAYANTAEDQIKEALKKTSKAEKLPDAKSVVIFGDSEAVVLTDNPRWVIKGQLYDMWQNKKINGTSELKHAAKKIPINKIKVNTKDIIDIRVHPEKIDVLTVFIDPFMDQSANQMYLLNKYANDVQIRYIFTAMSQENISRFFDFACETKGKTVNKTVQMVTKSQFKSNTGDCRKTEAMNSFGLTQFLRINTSPTLIAPNDIYHIGMPSNLVQWINGNK